MTWTLLFRRMEGWSFSARIVMAAVFTLCRHLAVKNSWSLALEHSHGSRPMVSGLCIGQARTVESPAWEEVRSTLCDRGRAFKAARTESRFWSKADHRSRWKARVDPRCRVR
jgi:hypothetical protein